MDISKVIYLGKEKENVKKYSLLNSNLISGYKVIWENLEDFDLSSKPETKITTALSAVVHGLDKYTNYSIQVLAYTNAGDGVPSSPLHCLTNEDGEHRKEE